MDSISSALETRESATSDRRPKLTSEFLDIDDIQERHRTQMFELFARHYSDVSYSRFLADLSEKDHVLLVRCQDREIAGFSTLSIHDQQVGDEPLRYLFSGDTILDSTRWGSRMFPKAWFRMAGQMKARFADRRLFWFTIFSGHRTYRVLPNFFKSYLPGDTQVVDVELETIRHEIAEARYGECYDRDTGLVDLGNSHGLLREDLASLDETAERNRHAATFKALNPNCHHGVDLAGIAELTQDNLKLYAASMFAAGLRDGA